MTCKAHLSDVILGRGKAVMGEPYDRMATPVQGSRRLCRRFRIRILQAAYPGSLLPGLSPGFRRVQEDKIK